MPRHVRGPWTVAAPPARPLLIYDGDCGFCRLWIERWRSRTGGAVDYAPSLEAAARFPEIPPAAFAQSVIFVGSDGIAVDGAHAALRALACAASGEKWLRLYRSVPGFSAVAEACYRVVAANRALFSGLTKLLWGRDVTPPTWFLSRSFFLRLMGAIYLAAFVSIWVQIDGLAGSRGIVPAAPWLDAGDRSLHLLCGSGAVVSALVVAGIAPAIGLALLWVLYLSVAVVCNVFLEFQWDYLLLEAGLIAVFLAPAGWRMPFVSPRPPSRAGLWLWRWLLFRLMLSSGIVKLSSGDPTWWGLTALRFHYETQPLPTWTSWYAHQMPPWFHTASAAAMFAVELAAPFFLIGPRRLRHAAACALLGLQTIIALTGNYGFFNLLSMALCLAMIDDTAWPPRWRMKLDRALEGARFPRPGLLRRWTVGTVAGLMALIGLVNFSLAFRTRLDWPEPVAALAEAVTPLRSINPYGLFSIMTTRRPEIVIEGSEDGVTWRSYEFRFKPGDTMRRPVFTTPHMPRLDWQMWFAALGDYRSNPWLARTMQRLLEGSPETLALLGSNPFPDKPPRQIRAVLYDYRFTRRTDTDSGAWWHREPIGPYSPVLTLAPARTPTR